MGFNIHTDCVFPKYKEDTSRIAQGQHIITIPGSKRIYHLEQNIQSEPVRLTLDDLQRIEVVMPEGTASGNRYPEKFMAALGR